MKQTFRILGAFIIATFIFTSCNNSSKKETNNTSTEASIGKSNLEVAKDVAKTIFEYVEQADSKQITKEELDIKAKPLQSQLDSLRLVLTANEIAELDSYRTQLFNEMIDRKVIRDQ
jgi:hypothetical protein